jgi:hypothetical protein
MERLFSPKVLDSLIESLKERQKDVNYIGDLADMGNEIGVSVGNLYPNMNPVEIEDFIQGLRHGISLTNGTH